jgi:hypothetical protein
MANFGKFPAGSDIVVRALPGIELSSHSQLQQNFDTALAKVGA